MQKGQRHSLETKLKMSVKATEREKRKRGSERVETLLANMLKDPAEATPTAGT